MSLNLITQVENFLLDEQTSARFKLRVGINSGQFIQNSNAVAFQLQSTLTSPFLIG
jgi:hypothetical protein